MCDFSQFADSQQFSVLQTVTRRIVANLCPSRQVLLLRRSMVFGVSLLFPWRVDGPQ